MNAIQITNLTKAYGKHTVVDNISLNIKSGSIFGFLGPNGAGKTTSIRMLLGLVKPTSGNAYIFGHDTRSHFHKISARVAAVVEVPSYFPYLTARETLKTLAGYSGMTVTDVICEKLLRDAGILDAADTRVDKFSLGMVQRLTLGAALLTDPDLIILDEPTNGLDPIGVLQVRKLLSSLAATGKTIFISSHVLSEVEQLCDEIAIIDKGVIRISGTVSDLLPDKQVTVKAIPIENAALVVKTHFEDAYREMLIDGNTLTFPHGFKEVPALIEKLSTAGVEIHEVTTKSLTLEEFFHRTVGSDRLYD